MLSSFLLPAKPCASFLYPKIPPVALRPQLAALLHISFLLALFVLLAGTDARQPRSHSSRPHRHPHCFHADELQNGEVPPMFRGRVARWRRHTALPTASSLEGTLAAGRRPRRHQEPTCADLKFQDLLNKDINERSISPWKYNLNEDDNRYPPRLAFAECLCRGCIDLRSGQESFSLNSMPVHQSLMVLRRNACQREDGTPGFSFEVQYISVPVACACVLPRSSS
ncbi:hypothetical protein JRQ81_006244 [Phrynocephalus forsythii]|uniref:Interleukin 17C n=1 Tax=Phrynocephalus forsythii TaxID=171643 RepID=A0A9Q1AUD6_9SAUR|nr:hypothetical protein JRQ81_006244 [Phrynocephalus forsythii]